MSGCHVYLGDLKDPNARLEEGECIGVVKGLTAAALAQGVDLAMRQVKGIYRKSDPNPLIGASIARASCSPTS